VAWTTAGSFAQSTSSPLAVTNTTAGNTRVVIWATSGAATVLSGGGVTTWNQTTTFTGTHTAAVMVIAFGQVTSTGSQSLAATGSPFEMMSQEFVPPSGAPTLDTSGHLTGTTTGSNIAGVSLTGTLGDLWVGYQTNVNSVAAGNTTGVVYTVTTSGDCIGWDLNSPSGAFAPNWSPVGAWDTLALMLKSGAAAAAYAPKGLVTRQARNRAGVY
jgi:hypothetical protein